eukprot:CAMPEP_0116564582 /NCGR_PEP_ID=MMETSP0397-20121206/13383_1 /TAXON_ID=216820 /ORGANISM="Cyclophora tenuis, Strain ECT3854" /LENGTH=314 /DNA_ID=CAMNT_0004091181 /DNA_START=84 /DNA_END=1028 /DNA_ORIENTATION=-
MPFSGGIQSFTAPRVGRDQAAKELEALSESERQDVIRDLYGLEAATEEDPKIIEQQLKELDEALEALPEWKKEHFERAQELCPEIANDPAFRLRFLRAERYDAEKAAQRTLKYWKFKEEIFGKDRAYRKLVLKDYTEDDLATARNHGLWLLPKPDQSGRAILFTAKPKWSYKHRHNLVRWVWYLAEAALEDESTQLNGILVIGFDDGPFSFSQFDRKLESKIMHLGVECMPVRWIAVHHFFDSKVHEMIVPFILFMVGKTLRSRFIIYPGSKRHTRLDKLEQVGMPRDILPKVMGGDDEFDVCEWMEERKAAGK